MFTVTLLTDPQTPKLTPERAGTLCSAWLGRDLRWLSAGEAAEFDIDERPADFWEIWEALQAEETDVIVQPRDGRTKRMLIADMDSTMIGQECIDELAEVAGVGSRVRDITARAMNGELDFEGALTERVALLAGLDTGVIDEVLKTRITLAPGGRTLLKTMKGAGGYAVLVSGGFTAFAGPIAADLGFDAHRANVLLEENGVLTGEVARPILGRDAKVETLHAVAEARGLVPDDVLAVGDGANDLGMLSVAGAGVALHAKPSVAAQSDIRVNFGDLTALLYLQGHARADFVT
ncbi:MAG: phosphoserine phosphatase SerB [Pseudomonadota bacterium]